MDSTVVSVFKGTISDAVVSLIIPKVVYYLQTRGITVTAEELAGPDCLGSPYTKTINLSVSGTVTPKAPSTKGRKSQVLGTCNREKRGRNKDSEPTTCGKDITKVGRDVCNTCFSQLKKKNEKEGTDVKATGLIIEDTKEILRAAKFDDTHSILEPQMIVFETATKNVIGKCPTFPDSRELVNLTHSDKILAKDRNLVVKDDTSSLPSFVPSTVSPVAQLPTLPVVPLPTLQPVAQLPTLPVVPLPTLQPVAQLPTLQPVAQLPTLQPVAPLPTMQPVAQLPTMQPVAQIPTVQPVSN